MPADPRAIAIASGKGGVGKTWFAITLADVLARRGRRVLLFDAHFGLANVDVQLGLMPRHDLGSVMERSVTLAEAVVRHPACQFDILAGCADSNAVADLQPEQLEALLAMPRDGSTGYDDIVLDLGAGLASTVRRMAAASDVLLALTTEEPTSLTDAYAVLKLHHADRPLGDARIVVNMVATQAAGERTYNTLRRACATFLRFDPQLAGIVRRDDKVRDAIRRQTPLLARHPSCRAAMDVEVVARGLVG